MILTNLFNDIRLVGLTGCIVSGVGLLLSSFVNDIGLLAFTYGALGGQCTLFVTMHVFDYITPAM